VKLPQVWTLSIATTSEAESAISEWLETMLGDPPVSYTDADTGAVTITSYLHVPLDNWPGFRRLILERLAHVQRCGLNPGSFRISCRKLKPRDWAHAWKRHFKPIEVGSALLIKPSWSARRARKGQATIILDPGLSFGTGQHPTTAFCLQQLTACRKHELPQSFLDIGTGSGILAIAAAKLGYAPVRAYDFDRQAVRIARGNAKRNRVLEKMRIVWSDLRKQPLRSARQYDVICANLISDLLIAEKNRILVQLKPGGTLIMAGILKIEFHLVRKAYEGAGFELLASRSEGEWQSGAFRMIHRKRR
jgi:ribosomal protein L11 methyltransferase